MDIRGYKYTGGYLTLIYQQSSSNCVPHGPLLPMQKIIYMKRKKSRDIEKEYTKSEFIKKLRRFADSLESGKKFRIQVKGETIDIPKDAMVNIEHESTKKEEELEFQIKWSK